MRTSDTPARRYYRVKEIGDLTGLAVSSLYSLIARGDIPSRKVGNVVLVPASWVDGAGATRSRSRSSKIA